MASNDTDSSRADDAGSSRADDAERPQVAVFRPDDERLAAARDRLSALGVAPVADPMLAVEPTGATPPTDADYVVFTSKTGADIVDAAGWTPGDATVVAIGAPTAQALEAVGIAVDEVPDTYSSSGLVDHLADDVADARVVVARSDHGSAVLLEGLRAAGADVTECVLYELVRPPEAGQSTRLAAAGELDGALFTSSLTVDHFLAAAREAGIAADALAGLDDAVVGVIGEPTRETAREAGIDVDVVPATAAFDALAAAAVDAIDESAADE